MPDSATNFITFDIEEWYHANYPGLDVSGFKDRPPEFRSLMQRLLDLCNSSGIKATFFVLGSIAETYPDIVRQISTAGHEVASHGYRHRLVSGMSPAEFREDLNRSCGILEAITGRKVLGFRAPSFSVTKAIQPWYYQTLSDAGLRYSSSVFAGKTFLYGIEDFPYRIHAPMSGIWEFPIPSLKLLHFYMGVYLRLFPSWFVNRLIRRSNAHGAPMMLYLHPREIDPDQPRLPLSAATKFIHYFGIKGCETKVRSILASNAGSFETLIGYLETMPQSQVVSVGPS